MSARVRSLPRSLAVACLVFAAGATSCDEESPADAGMDAGARRDAGAADEDAGRDAGSDAGDLATDAGPPRDGGTDAGTPDAGTPDAGMPDAGPCEESPCRLVFPQCGCPAGEACTLDAMSRVVCEPAGPAAEGEDCSVRACAAGLVCAESPAFDMCVRFCDTDLDCVAGPGSQCLFDFGVARACTVACDPVLNTGCPPGAGCTILETAAGSGVFFTNCRPEGAGVAGDLCGNETQCQGGHSCRAPAGPRVCTRWCRSSMDCAPGERCAFELTIGITTYGRCAP